MAPKKKAATKNYKSYRESKRPKIGRFKKSQGSFKGTLKEYMRKWEAFYEANHTKPDWGKQSFKDFFAAEGEYIDEFGLKYRPNILKNKRTGKFDFPGKILSNTSDADALQRIHRAEILTYIFGGDAATTAQLSYTNELGEVIEVHHKFANAEFAPFVDDIIDDLKAPKGSKQWQEGMEKLNAGRKYFFDSPYFAGDVKENFEGLTELQHRGKGPSVHNQLGPVKQLGEDIWMGSDITESMGKTPYPKGKHSKLSFKKGYPGIQVDPNKPPMPTGDYVRTLPWSIEESMDFTVAGDKFGPEYLQNRQVNYRTAARGGPRRARERQTRWSALEELMDHSGGLRDEIANYARIDPRLKTEKELEHIAKGGRPPTPGTSWAQRSAEARAARDQARAIGGVKAINQGLDGTMALHSGLPLPDVESMVTKAADMAWDFGEKGRDMNLTALDNLRAPMALSEGATVAGKLARKAGALVPFAGAAFDTIDAAEKIRRARQDPNFWNNLQAGMAVGTVGTSFWNEPTNFLLGIGNLTIDATRGVHGLVTDEEKREEAYNMLNALGQSSFKALGLLKY